MYKERWSFRAGKVIDEGKVVDQVKTAKEEGRASICSLVSTGAVKIMVHGELHMGPCTKDNIIADVFITGRYHKALFITIKKACHLKGCPPSS